ncbi:MAG: hypothetical protein IKC48_02670 [Clostridia bacterium]|nr:hypothetical protein [Clostridia bacterium]
MKRIFCLMAIVILCTFSLCACSPSEDKAKKTYEDNGYRLYEPGLNMAEAEGAAEADLEFYFLAIGEQNLYTVYVMGFKDVASAKEFQEKKSKNTAGNFAVKRRGRVVAFGEADGVSLL